MAASGLVDRVLSSGVSKALREHDFRRKGRVFSRRLEEVSNLIDVEVSRQSVPAEGLFVLNVGAYHPDLERILHAAVVDEPSEPGCTIRTRIGPASDERDPWWRVHDEEEQAICFDVVNALRDRALPWLRIASDLPALDEALSGATEVAWTPNALTPVAVALLLGRRELASARIAAILERLHAKRAERRAAFGGREENFGRGVFALAERLRREHDLT